jgi:DoxX-like family
MPSTRWRRDDHEALLFSVGVKIVLPPGAAEHFAELGWRIRDVRGLAIVELCCTLVYLVPRTAPLGAILLTGYLGGATATHVRIGDGVFLYPFVLGVALWGGLALRAPWLRQLLLGVVRGDRVVPGSARVDARRRPARPRGRNRRPPRGLCAAFRRRRRRASLAGDVIV